MTLESALQLVLDAHRGQRDLNGMPVVLHPLRVGMAGKTESEMIVGFLHDVVEDTDMGIEDIAKVGFGKEVVEALTLLTHEDGMPYEDYVRRIVESGNELALAVKRNDLKDNIARNDCATEKKKGIFEKHQKALRMITQTRIESAEKRTEQQGKNG